MTDASQLRPATEWYDKWLGKMYTKLMCLQNSRSEFLIEKVDERILNYLNNNCLNFDWKNHFILIILIETAQNKDFQTIYNTIGTLNSRFKDIFNHFNITRLLDFDPNVHLYANIKNAANEITTRLRPLKYIKAIVKQMALITISIHGTKFNKFISYVLEKIMKSKPFTKTIDTTLRTR